MPLWDFHLSSGILSYAEKEQLSKAITKIYTAVGLPAFYVQVRFTEGQSTCFVGGDFTEKEVVIQIDHVARNMTTNDQQLRFLEKVDNVLNPVFKPKDVHWEYWTMEGPRELWKIDSITPPPTGSKMEKKWARLNAPYVEQARDLKGCLNSLLVVCFSKVVLVAKDAFVRRHNDIISRKQMSNR